MKVLLAIVIIYLVLGGFTVAYTATLPNAQLTLKNIIGTWIFFPDQIKALIEMNRYHQEILPQELICNTDGDCLKNQQCVDGICRYFGNVANPASKYCEKQGGINIIVDCKGEGSRSDGWYFSLGSSSLLIEWDECDGGSQNGYCLKDRDVCKEWDFFTSKNCEPILDSKQIINEYCEATAPPIRAFCMGQWRIKIGECFYDCILR